MSSAVLLQRSSARAVGPAAVLVATGAGLILADGAVVVLAVPDLAQALHATVTGVAAVIAVYTAALGIAAFWAGNRLSSQRLRHLAPAGFSLFMLASIASAAASTLPAMLLARGLQGTGGGLALVAAKVLLDASGRGHQLWRPMSLGGILCGPALGGALTQAFGWSAIFLVCVPVAAAAAVASTRLAAPAPTAPGPAPRTHITLALFNAALVAMLFVLVLMLVAGWNLQPIAAAAVMTMLPVAALVGSQVRRERPADAVAGALLLAGAIAAAAVMRGSSVPLVLSALAVGGFGVGMAIPLLGDGSPRATAVRHGAITLVLLALSPLIGSQMERASDAAREQQVAALLSSELPPAEKFALLPELGAQTGAGIRDAVRDAFASAVARSDDPESARRLAQRGDDIVIEAVAGTVRVPLLLLAALALTAAVSVPRRRRPDRRIIAASSVAAALVIAGGSITAPRQDPAPLSKPCEAHHPPTGSSSAHALQRTLLATFDRTACSLNTTVERLLTAAADSDKAQTFQDEHGVDPRDVVLQGFSSLGGAGIGLLLGD